MQKGKISNGVYRQNNNRHYKACEVGRGNFILKGY